MKLSQVECYVLQIYSKKFEQLKNRKKKYRVGMWKSQTEINIPYCL